MSEKTNDNQPVKLDRDSQLKKFYKNEFELYEESNSLLNNFVSKDTLMKQYKKLVKAYYKNLRMSLKITTIGDSTQNKLLKVQETIRDQKEKLRAIFDNAITSIITLDLNAQLLSYNCNFQQMIDNEEDLINTNFYTFLYESDKAIFETLLNKIIIRDIKDFRVQARLVVNNNPLWADFSVSTIYGKENNPESIIIIINDIDQQIKTQEKLAESYLQYKKAQEEILKLEKTTTVLAMAVTANHEINQPLTVIKANLDMINFCLDSFNVDDKIKKYIQRIDESINSITHILEKFKKPEEVEFNDYGGNTIMVSFNNNNEYDSGVDDPFDDL
ncbi:MAG TPA: PAS domain S-box protein [Candidatus Cloacimonadota bacterium]|jgi:PAS domain S-box-containing protein|nr:PAS domain S-box protein [Candidatus Cloacimonadales bacterium]HPY96379.1 PAS domain S-box protein [Candidatus Cloacimonadota bacterium]HQB40672.1 PAS domain S-box protein [Candidatus Cloacimonadota bacterium]